LNGPVQKGHHIQFLTAQSSIILFVEASSEESRVASLQDRQPRSDRKITTGSGK
jgi:hypothetical protein